MTTQYWVDNSTSVTVYYKEEELEAIQEWLYENYNKYIKSISFLLHSDHGYKQAPYEVIDEATYNEMIKDIVPLTGIDNDHGGKLMDSMECAEGSCPII